MCRNGVEETFCCGLTFKLVFGECRGAAQSDVHDSAAGRDEFRGIWTTNIPLPLEEPNCIHGLALDLYNLSLVDYESRYIQVSCSPILLNFQSLCISSFVVQISPSKCVQLMN